MKKYASFAKLILPFVYELVNRVSGLRRQNKQAIFRLASSKRSSVLIYPNCNQPKVMFFFAFFGSPPTTFPLFYVGQKQSSYLDSCLGAEVQASAFWSFFFYYCTTMVQFLSKPGSGWAGDTKARTTLEFLIKIESFRSFSSQERDKTWRSSFQGQILSSFLLLYSLQTMRHFSFLSRILLFL